MTPPSLNKQLINKPIMIVNIIFPPVFCQIKYIYKAGRIHVINRALARYPCPLPLTYPLFLLDREARKYLQCAYAHLWGRICHGIRSRGTVRAR
jgi:hypothetical protein